MNVIFHNQPIFKFVRWWFGLKTMWNAISELFMIVKDICRHTLQCCTYTILSNQNVQKNNCNEKLSQSQKPLWKFVYNLTLFCSWKIQYDARNTVGNLKVTNLKVSSYNFSKYFKQFQLNNSTVGLDCIYVFILYV